MAALGSEAQLAERRPQEEPRSGGTSRGYSPRSRHDTTCSTICSALNIDRAWRRRRSRQLAWERHPDGIYLDLCAGTLDVAAELSRASRGSRDRSWAPISRSRCCAPGTARRRAAAVAPVVADALAAAARRWRRCDGAIVAFGIRNVADLDAALAEIYRVLTPGGAIRDSRVLDAALGGGPRRSITPTSITCCRSSAALVSGQRDGVPISPAVSRHFPAGRSSPPHGVGRIPRRPVVRAHVRCRGGPRRGTRTTP